ncbi:DUF3893 domain-containing protein [Nostoc sp. CCCryo 231-06]|nr:DUF3893 domain-containing protein [Nostoc sp. CCCryo 231-06]
MQPLGIQVFDDYSLLKVSHDVDDTASRMINLPTLIGGVIEALETNANNLKFTPKYLEQFNDIQLDSLLVKYFNIRLEEIERQRKALQFTKIKRKDQSNELKSLIQANQAAMRRLYPNERPSLYIFYEDNMLIEVELVKEITRILWGDTLEIIPNRLPPNTHGPQEDILVGKDLKPKKRSGERLKAWESIAKQIKNRNKPTFCLIIARKFYPDPTGQKVAKIDDKVNKPSTRQALATMAGACVQFMQPIAKTQKTKRFKLENFFHRLQAAMKDLLFAHSGRIDDVQEKVDKYLKSIPPEARPKEIIVFTIDRKQRGSVRGFIGNTFLAEAMRIKVDAGKCEFCCAYEKGNKLTISPWSSFPDGLAFIAGLTPVKLADKPSIYKTRFMDFVKKIVSKSVEAGAQPLIMIDSSNCAQLWAWLKDVEINTNKIDLGSHENMQDEWQGARLIRIRQEIAPGIIEKKERHLMETFLEDTRTKEELNQLSPKLKIPSASSSTGLFRLSATNQTGCVAYLSVRKLPHQYSRGQSCYRSTQTLTKKPDADKKPISNKAGLNVYQLSTQTAFVDRWPSPNPLEIVVTLRQPEDNPDDLAALVESLRYGFGHYSDWTALPGPLFFKRVVRDYISDFAIADEDIESEQD